MQRCLAKLALLLPLWAALGRGQPMAGPAGEGATSTAAGCAPPPLPPSDQLLAAQSAGAAGPALVDSLVAAVAEARLLDSKAAADLPLTAPPAEVAAALQALGLPDPATDPAPYHNDPGLNATLLAFLQRWTAPPGSDLSPPAANLTDGPPPPWIQQLTDPTIGAWAEGMYRIWDLLARQVDARVAAAPQQYTSLWVPAPQVVPGFDSREASYWGSLWIVKGLLVSELSSVALDQVLNWIYLVEQFGHVPAGTRTYDLPRSAPPLLSEMVRVVAAGLSEDRALLARALPALLREHAYWTEPPKQVAAVGPDGRQYLLSRYYSASDQPRPERWLEDRQAARSAGFDPRSEPSRQIYLELASAAESGWELSSRWMAEDPANMSAIRATRILPADLNAFLFRMESTIAAFAERLGCGDVAQRYDQLAAERKAAINALMWDAQSGQWRDLVCTPAGSAPAAAPPPGTEALLRALAALSPAAEAISLGAHDRQQVCDVTKSSVSAASNWVPLWAGVAKRGSPQALQAVDAFTLYGFNQVGGVPATSVATGQQWDFPDVFPPLTSMLVEAFEQFGGEAGHALAEQLAQRYLTNALAIYEATGVNYASANAVQIGTPGGSREGDAATGFGWTNGVALELLQNYGYSNVPLLNVLSAPALE